MNPFRELFTERHTFLPVIHVHKRGKVLADADFRQVLHNVDIAESCGADGVFLISRGRMKNEELIELYMVARDKHPEFWIGLNFLELTNERALSIVPDKTCGLWCDNGGITDTSVQGALAFSDVRALSEWRGIYFGGVAFKQQEPVHDLVGVSKRATPFMDVITTSGDATGIPPSPQKIATIKKAAGDVPVAIASGMGPDNVHLYPMADCFLVATKISKSEYELDPKLVVAFENKLDHSVYEPLMHMIAS